MEAYGAVRNVEIKATDPDPARTLALALAAGALDRGTIEQRDTYFRVAEGRLKLREPDQVLIPYRRAGQLSRYELIPAAPGLKEALSAALGVRVVVAKRRRLLLWEETVRIHLDTVDGLEPHMEIEAVASEDSDLAHERDQLQRLRDLLEIGDERLVSGSYADLLLAPDPELVRLARQAQRRAHAPYSRLPVGAALRSSDGARFAGANVENAAHPQGQCAEASALGALVAGGGGALAEVVVTHVPCGGCRQRLREFGDPDVPVHVLADGRTYTLGELLPRAFAL